MGRAVFALTLSVVKVNYGFSHLERDQSHAKGATDVERQASSSWKIHINHLLFHWGESVCWLRLLLRPIQYEGVLLLTVTSGNLVA